MHRQKTKQKTVKIPAVLSIILSITIILLIVYFTVDANTIRQLASTTIRYEFFFLAVLLNILYWILWGVRLQILSNAIDDTTHISLRNATKIVIANLFLAGITPSMAGGEPVRIHLLNKQGISLGGATAAVLGERLLDAIFMLVCVPFAFYIYKDKPGIEVISIGLWIGVFVFLILLILFAYAILRPEKIKSLLIALNKIILRFSKKKDKESKIITRVHKEVDNFHCSMSCFVGEKKKSFIKASLITVLFWSTGFLIPSMILLGLNLPPYFIESYAAQILLLVIIMLPLTPGSAGITELGIAGLYGILIGTGQGTLLGVFVILYRFVTYHMNLIAGGIFQYRIFKSVASFSLDSIKKEKDICK